MLKINKHKYLHLNYIAVSQIRQSRKCDQRIQGIRGVVLADVQRRYSRGSPEGSGSVSQEGVGVTQSDAAVDQLHLLGVRANYSCFLKKRSFKRESI